MATRIVQTPFGRKFKIQYDENTGKAVSPKCIGVRPMCEHADACPSLQYLSKAQLRLFKALQSCDMKAVLSMEWVLIYQTLQTFETLGLINIIEGSESCKQLEHYTTKIIPERISACHSIEI